MSTELEQLAATAVDRLYAKLRELEFSELTDGQRNRIAWAAKLEAFREVQRQTIEACAKTECRYCREGSIPHYAEQECGHNWQHGDGSCCYASRVRSLLSQKVI